jgi:hypothetical protein
VLTISNLKAEIEPTPRTFNISNVSQPINNVCKITITVACEVIRLSVNDNSYEAAKCTLMVKILASNLKLSQEH